VLRFAIAVDAFGADPPHLLEHELQVTEGARVKVDDAAHGQPEAIIDGTPVPGSRPWPGLLQVVLNAILYATSPGVEPEARLAPKQRTCIASVRRSCASVRGRPTVPFGSWLAAGGKPPPLRRNALRVARLIEYGRPLEVGHNQLARVGVQPRRHCSPSFDIQRGLWAGAAPPVAPARRRRDVGS